MSLSFLSHRSGLKVRSAFRSFYTHEACGKAQVLALALFRHRSGAWRKDFPKTGRKAGPSSAWNCLRSGGITAKELAAQCHVDQPTEPFRRDSSPLTSISACPRIHTTHARVLHRLLWREGLAMPEVAIQTQKLTRNSATCLRSTASICKWRGHSSDSWARRPGK